MFNIKLIYIHLLLCSVFTLMSNNALANKISNCSNCVSSNSSNTNLFKEPYQLSDEEVCNLARNRKNNGWETFIPFSKKYVEEASFRKLKCGLKQKNPYKFHEFSKTKTYKTLPRYWCKNRESFYRTDSMPILVKKEKIGYAKFLDQMKVVLGLMKT